MQHVIGDGLGPIHAGTAGKRYRYYISSRLKAGRSGQADGWRIPASEIEAIVLQQIGTLPGDKPMLSCWLQEAGHTACIEAGLAKAEQASAILNAAASPSPDIRAIIRTAIRRIDLADSRIRIAIDRSTTANWLAGTASQPVPSDPDLHIVDLLLTIRQRGVERRLVIEGQGAPLHRPDQPLIDKRSGSIATAHAAITARPSTCSYCATGLAQIMGPCTTI